MSLSSSVIVIRELQWYRIDSYWYETSINGHETTTKWPKVPELLTQYLASHTLQSHQQSSHAIDDSTRIISTYVLIPKIIKDPTKDQPGEQDQD